MPERAISLIIIDDSADDIERITRFLRNSGIAVRSRRATNAEELIAALRTQSWDLVLAVPELGNFGARAAIALLADVDSEIPVVVIADAVEESDLVQAMQTGASDMVAKDQLNHLQQVILREQRNVRGRRRHRVCRRTLLASERRCRSLMESSHDAITYIHEGMHISANPAYLELFGYSDENDVEGTPMLDMVAPTEHERFKAFLRGLVSARRSQKGSLEARVVRTDSTQFNAVIEFTPATVRGEDCTQLIIRKRHERTLEHELDLLRRQDLLTGLFNRRHLLDVLDKRISESTGDELGGFVLYIELDNFDAIKDRIGIAASDVLLSDVAKLIREEFPKPHAPARFYGHSFAILVQENDVEAVQQMARKIRKLIGEHICEVDGQSVVTTCSVGISPLTKDCGSGQTVMTQANQACRLAQAADDSAIHVYQGAETVNEQTGFDSLWVPRIESGLKRDRFTLVYQPIVNLHEHNEQNYEVLLRMLDDHDDLVGPAEFLPAAQRAGLMGRVDRWVVAHAVKILSEERRSGNTARFFLKLSPDTVTDTTFLAWLTKLLKKHHAPGDRFVFEISESAAMTYLAQAKTLVGGLKFLHCHVAIDHFGNSLDSFQVLKYLDVDFLKLDGSLIKDLASNRKNQVAVKSVTEMARSLGKLTMAELVQDASSLALLWQCGIGYIQGYFLQAPSTSLNYDFSSGDL